jgi:hypothetical protein
MKKRLVELAAFVAVLLAAACGGGGVGGDGTGGLAPAQPPAAPPAPSLQLNTSAVELQPGETADVAILSGTPPYTVSTSSSAVAHAVVADAPARIVVSGGMVVRGSTADLTLTDAAGKTATVKVTVNYPAISVAPLSLSIAAGDSAPFVVNGGVPPYQLVVTDSNALALSTASLPARGSSASVQARGITQQPASVVVTDAVGTSISITVTTSAASALLQSLVVAPTDSTGTSVAAGTAAAVTLQASAAMAGHQVRFERRSGDWRFDPGDGVPVDGSSATVTVGSTGLAVARLHADETALTQSAVVRAVDVTDSTKFLDSVFTIAGLALGVTPDTFVAQNGSAACGGQVAAFQVLGGKPPYVVASTRPTSAQVLTPNVSASGGAFTVLAGPQCDGTSGPTNIFVRDAAGASTVVKFYNVGGVPTAALSVVPDTIQLVVGQTAAFSVQNGTLPFTVSSSNPAVATASAVPGSLTAYNVVAHAPGNALINITDATSQAVSVAVTVVPTSALKVTPATVSARLSAGTAVFVVSGGQAPYTAVSSVPAVATLTQTAPGQFTAIFAGTLGTTDIVVQDANGQVASSTLTVTN